MKVVVGLGNPGKQYEKTRHNVGWMVLDRIADRAGIGGRVKARDTAAVVIGRVDGLELVLAKPTTYMNLSGVAVRKVLARERAPKSDMLVIVDDFALPLGKLRMRGEGSAGGQPPPGGAPPAWPPPESWNAPPGQPPSGGAPPSGPPPGAWKPPVTETPRRTVWLFVGGLLALVVGLAVLVAVAAPGVFQRIIDALDPANTPIRELSIGRCFNGAPSSDGTPEFALTVKTLDCAQAHDGELYAVVQLPDGAYPGDDGISRLATDRCFAQFEAYVGIGPERSVLEVAYFYPTSRSWLTGDRAVQCLITASTGQSLTGSVKGARR